MIETVPKSFRKYNAVDKYVKRVKLEGEASPPVDDLFDRPVYTTGDGDFVAQRRPGAMDFMNYRSIG